MPWYYAENGKQSGPVTDEQFQSLVTNGSIRADTLVWREGMSNWQTFNSVASGQAPSPAGAPTAAAPVAGGVVCTECRQTFPVDQTVRFGDAFVCAGCKPIYVQKLREGAVTAAPGTVRYGGFWIRVAAKLVDGLIVGIPTAVIYGLLIFAMGVPLMNMNNPNPAAAFGMLGMQLAAQGIAMLLGAAYSIYFLTKYAATPGKMVCGLKVINADGSPLRAGKATGRFFAEWLSGLTCYIGYIIAGFDAEKRTLHDHICATRVVYKNP